MSTLTRISANQIQPATATSGITADQISATANISVGQLAGGENIILRDGSVAMTGNLVVIPGVASDHAVNKGQLDTAVANASAAATTLTQAVADEVGARTLADTALGGRIDATNTALTGETTARLAAETTLSNSVTQEATARQNGDNSLQTQIDAEQAARISAVASANDAISTEASNRAAADTALQTTVNSLLTEKADKAGNASQVFAVASPTQDSHSANKAYVDGVAQGLDIKGSVRAATSEPIALAGLIQVDGVQLGVGDRVLVKNQADAKENGIYVATGGSWSRADDADNSPGAEFTAGLFVFVEEGNTHAQSGWACSTPNTPLYTLNGVPAIQLGAVNVAFVQFSGAGQIICSTGLQKSGNTLSITDTGVATGEYTKVTVDAQGRVTAGANPTTIAGYGLTDAANISGSQTQVFQVQAAAATFDAINKGQLDAAVLALTNSLSSGGNDLTAEAATRAAADTALGTQITTESTNRIAAIAAEAATRAADDATIQGLITTEANTRAGQDTVLQNNIDSTNTALTNETTARSTNDAALGVRIDNTNTTLNTESSTRASEDATLQTNITTEASTRAAAITTVADSVTAEATTRTAQDAILQANIDTVTAAVATEKTARETAVAAEATARDAADATLQTNINTLSNNLANNYYTSNQVDTRFTNLINAAPAALDTLGEIAAAIAEGGTTSGAITTAISNEVTRATAAEAVLQTNIDGVATDLDTEITRAGTIEALLNTNLGEEIARATAAEGVLTTNLAAEVTNRTNAVAGLTASTGLERVGADFRVKLATESHLVADVDGLRIDLDVVTANRLKVRDPFSGAQNGSNKTFTFSVAPVAGSEQIFVNGLLQYPGAGNDYTVSGSAITFTVAPAETDRISINFTAAA